MQIGSNPMAQTAVLALHAANSARETASERISTGLRVNRASDDPVGMMVGNRFKTQITSLAKAIDNVSQGVSMTQIVDSALSQMVDLLGYMRVSAVAAQSGSATASDRTGYQDALDAYVDEIDSISDNATWSGTSLMGASSQVDIQSGTESGNTITINFSKVTASELGINSLSLSSAANAADAVDDIDSALESLSQYQSYMGAMANVMTTHSDLLTGVSSNYSAAYGNIMNADLAQETANLAKAQILGDGATAMLAQSSSMNQMLVSYLLKSYVG
ncbi:MAG: flagellin [Limnohabitans sp.]|jgi:flagellin